MLCCLGFKQLVAAESVTDVTKRPETASPVKKVGVSDDIQAIIERAAKKQDFSKELQEIVSKQEVAIPTLITVFRDGSKPWQQRWFSGIALSKFNQEKTKQVLIKGTHDPVSNIRSVAVQALAAFDDEESTSAVKKAMADTSLMVRDTAVRSLGKLKDRGSVDLLNKELFNQQNYYHGQALFDIRGDTIVALGEIGSMKAVDPLMKILKSDNDKTLKIRACDSLEKIVKPSEGSNRSHDAHSCPDYWTTWYQNQKNTPMMPTKL